MTLQPLYQRMLHRGLDTVQSRSTRLCSTAVVSCRGFTMFTGSSETDFQNKTLKRDKRLRSSATVDNIVSRDEQGLRSACFYVFGSRPSCRILMVLVLRALQDHQVPLCKEKMHKGVWRVEMSSSKRYQSSRDIGVGELHLERCRFSLCGFNSTHFASTRCSGGGRAGGGAVGNGGKQTTPRRSDDACTLTLHRELGLRAVVEGFAAVGAPVRYGQFVEGETVAAAVVCEGAPGPRVDQYPLPHPLHFSRIHTHLHLEGYLLVLLSYDWCHFLDRDVTKLRDELHDTAS
ncbi:hypothetical protein EYF80_027918 [Liparis tanakae]|uniref:Uncharacterized protein n=1 Tax=Liparis tanakae TaxID=230148 RepID=A0A4Z2HAT6_9TELE|nr:hypothetical protein EYF80_027918 [Liparis tanakae]